MQQSQLNRVIQLIKRTGDKMALLDNESDSVLMIMELGAYEKMLEHPVIEVPGVEKLTEEELMEKINRDVAIWRAYNDKEHLEKIVPEEVVEPKVSGRGTQFVDEKRPTIAKNIDSVSQINTSLREVPINSEESASDIVAEEEEEKFYLEPIE